MKKRILILVLALVMLCSFGLTACGGGGGGDEEYDVSIRLFLNNGHYFDGAEKNSIWKELEKAAQANIEIQGASQADYETTFFPMINTLDFPDMFFAADLKEAGQIWADPDDGILWNYDDLFAMYPGEFPYLEEILSSDQYKNLITMGQHVMLPNPSAASGWGVYYRADWLKAVGWVNDDGTAKVPTTLDEMYEVMKLFTYNDPDGNGKDDTFGFNSDSEVHFFNVFATAFGVHPDGDIRDGSYYYGKIQPEFKAMLQWLNKLVEEGLMDPNFNTNKNYAAREDFENGNHGIHITNAEDHIQWCGGPVMKLYGDESIIMGPAPKGTATTGKEGSGGFVNWGGSWGGFYIPKATTGENLKAVLRLLDYCYSPEGSMTKTFGIKGVHYDSYSSETGLVLTEENLENRLAEPEGLFYKKTLEDGSTIPAGTCQFSGMFAAGPIDWEATREAGAVILIKDFIGTMGEAYGKLANMANDYMYYFPAKLVNVGGYPNSIATKSNKINDLANAYMIKAILGQANFTTDWDQLLADVEEAGYSEVVEIRNDHLRSLGILE